MTLCDDATGTIIAHNEENRGTGEGGCKELHVPYQRIDQRNDNATIVMSANRTQANNDVPMIAPPTATSSSSSTYHHHRNRHHHRHQTTDTSATEEKPELTPLMNMLASVSIHSALMTHSTTNSDEENELPLTRSLSSSVGGRTTKGKTLFRELKQPPPGGATAGTLSSIGKPYRQVFNLSPFNKGKDHMM